MKTSPLFNLKVLKSNSTQIFVVLPELQKTTIDLLNYCIEFLHSYQKITFLCSYFEVSFYRLLLNKSKTFSPFRDRLDVDIVNHFKLKEIQAKECLIVYLSDGQAILESNKKAIFCAPDESSDIVFDEMGSEAGDVKIYYLKKMLAFLGIPDKKPFTSIELSPSDIISSSSIASKLTEKKYCVIVIQNIIAAFKLSNFLKKNKLKKQLVVISKTKLKATDPKLITFKDYNFLDFLAFQLQAVNISCSKPYQYEKVINNLRINLSFFATFKDTSHLLFDITEPKHGNNSSA